MKTRKGGIIAGLIVVLLIFAGLTWVYLPVIIAKAVISEGMIDILPAKKKVAVNEKFDKLLAFFESANLGITIDDIIEVIDKSTSEQIINTINQLENTELKTKEQVFQIVRQNIDLCKLDNEKTRKVLLERLKMSDVKRMMKMIRDNGKPYILTIPMGKETAKDILIEKKKKIEQHINS